ncbi:MAG: T9SS type A sorting domain-containing protein [Saprospiraceae bacterium]|nr:T9SS type A sorting domain-containing protein [Saprospiraceae bacterium]
MMSRIYLVFVLLVSMTVFVSFENNPPNGRTGAPGDGLCSDCHSLDGGTQDGILTVSGFPALIEPSTAYILTITNSNPNGVGSLAGFQMTVLNSSNLKAGVMTSPSVNSTVSPQGIREYWEHNPAQLYPGNNMYSWTVTWTSPTGPPNTMITCYGAGNVADDSGNNDGDLIITTTSTGMINGGGDPLEAEIVSFTDVLCNGGNTGSVTAGGTGGTMPYSYAWSNGGNTATINNLSVGTYTVTITDNDGSTATASAVISQPTALVLQTPTINNVSCFGGANGSIQASASGGVPPYDYSWSNGSSGSFISGLVAGSYTVTVTDDNNCTKVATYQVTQPPLLAIALVNLSDESCFGEDDGAISISISGGATPYFAEWSNGFIGTTITGLTPDTYSVTVTDNNDCTKTASYTVNPGGIVIVTLQLIEHVSCNGGNDGAISVSATGGEAPYTYLWSNGGNGPSISSLPAGNYLVTASDNNGCQVVKLYTILQPGPITVTINPSGQNLCTGDNMVDLTAVPSGEQSPFTGLWSNGVVGLTNNDLAAGTYTVTVTDITGCTASSSYTVTAPPLLVVTVLTTDETSSGANDGTAVAIPSGGTPGYTYLWSNGSTADSIGGLPPGVYSVTISDANGCITTGSGQVDEFGCNLEIDLGPDVTVCQGDTVILSAPPGFISYQWSTGETTSDIMVTQGEYCVTVTDAEGCNDVDCIIITESVFPLITCPVTNESLPGANDGAIVCDSISGSIQYLWSNGSTTSSISGLTPGIYCVTMTDASGCTDEQCFTVQPGNCQLVITSIFENVLCAGDLTGAISVNVENATPPVSYLWSNGDTTATINNLGAGPYSVTVGDAAGCLEILTFVITEPEPLQITIDTIIDIGVSGGSVQVTINGGIPPYAPIWVFPDSTLVPQEDLSLLTQVGFYTLLVTDQNGCTTVATVLVELDVAVNPGPDFKPLKVYPVPTGDVLHVDFDRQMTEVMIMGIDGRLQKQFKNPASNNLQVADLEPGWYIIRMTDGVSWYIARMVK